ncbi:inverse autotransporter beta domain-containing protein [Salmonella enterica subsp. enterica serovar Saintpaul]|nr:inverse autotransporter beta domain-containing protein [Salmonella enterica subsp. enterica serovar Saintpaul]
MTPKLTHLSAALCLTAQLTGTLAGSLLPVVSLARAEQHPLFSSHTALYSLKQGETVDDVAKNFGLSTQELRTLNEFRTFSKPFEQLEAGDEVDVPVPQSTPLDAKESFGTPRTTETSWANKAVTAGQLAGSDDAGHQAVSIATGAATGAAITTAQDWLGQFGTSRVELNLDDDFSLDESSVDFLYPFYDAHDHVMFTQLGYRHREQRNTINAGLGFRTFQDSWMYGINSFYDDDMTGHNRRIGFGLEAWTDYFKLSANSYSGITDWHQSRDFVDYDERPADGFDIRAEGWLPSYPQLGGKLVYEQYSGNDVALFSRDDRSDDPKVVTLGVNYTPVPLVTFGMDFRQGQNSQSDTKFNLAFSYRPGVPLSRQLDPDAVDFTRKLAATRYDLVERNNDVVLEYKKQASITLKLPPLLSGKEGETGIVNASVKSRYGTDHLVWNYSDVLAAGGSVVETDKLTLKITYPPYKLNGNNTYHVRAVAWDTRGNRSNRSTTEIIVSETETTTSRMALTVTHDNAKATGLDTNTVQTKITDTSGNPVTGVKVNFTADNGATVITPTVTTDANGLAITSLTNTVAGSVNVTAEANDDTLTVSTTFLADDSSAIIKEGDLIVTKDNATADGVDSNAVSAKITDSNGNVVPGIPVSFTADNGASVMNTPVITDANGVAATGLTNTTAGVSVVTASVNGSRATVNTTFIPSAIAANLELTVLKGLANNDGIDFNTVQAHVTDNNGNSLKGVSVSFSAFLVGGNVTVLTTPVITDENGVAVTNLTSLKTGVATVIAQTGDLVAAEKVMFGFPDQS